MPVAARAWQPFREHPILAPALLAIALALGCGDNLASPAATSTVARVSIDSVAISPAPTTVALGAQVTLQASGYRGNTQVALTGCGWGSDDAGVATVSDGVVTGVGLGATLVTAFCSGMTASSLVTVTQAAASVLVTPASAILQVGDSAQLAASATDSSGNVVAGKTFTWSSSVPGVATVSAGGMVRGVAAGSATITATLDGKTASALVTVSAPPATPPATAASVTVSPATATVTLGGSLQLTATPRDSAGKALSGRPIAWSSSAPAVATVSAGGLVTAQSPGTASISATVDGRSGSASVSVTQPAPAVGVVFADDFESGYAGKQNSAGWQSTSEPNISVSSDVAHTGSHSLKFTYLGKADCLDSSAEQRFSLGHPMQEVWLEWYMYFPAGGEGGSAAYYHRWQYPVCGPSSQQDNNKFVGVFGPNYQGETTSVIQTWTTTLAGSVPPTAPGDSRIQTAYSMAGQKGVVYNAANYNPFVSGAGDRGRWMQIRLHFRVADFGQNNGVIQMWKDGVMILSNTTLAWYDSSNTANYLTQGYLLGWSNSGYAQTTNIYIDDFKIIDTNPGW